MTKAPDVLNKILARKRVEVMERAERVPLAAMAERAARTDAPRGLRAALESRIETGDAAVIAEIKKASPSKGVLREDFDPPAIALGYERGGAAALSVLTDIDFFQGADEYLLQARGACALPALRKDFVIDAYQVYEARALGADCILLIVAALGDASIVELAGLASHLGMDTLIEVHDAEELNRISQLEGAMIGINNRNLRTFETSLDTTLRLLDDVPDGSLVVTESGIHTPQDVSLMRDNGVHAFLIGEAFMRADDPGARLAALFSG